MVTRSHLKLHVSSALSLQGPFLGELPNSNIYLSRTLLPVPLAYQASEFSSMRLNMAPFSWVDDYSFATTESLVIYQFYQNANIISVFTSVFYKIHKKCKHFQWPVAKSYHGCLKKIATTEILVFNFELFVGLSGWTWRKKASHFSPSPSLLGCISQL